MSKHWALRNIWKLEPLQIEQLDKYYLLRWKPTYLLKQIEFPIQSLPMILIHQGVTYEVILEGFKLTDALLDKDVRLSFRKHKEEETGVVMIMRNKYE